MGLYYNSFIFSHETDINDINFAFNSNFIVISV